MRNSTGASFGVGGWSAVAAVAVALALATWPARATHPLGAPDIEVSLNGQNEVGANGQLGAGDPDGAAVARLWRDHEDLTWHISYQNISGEAISGLHIHGPGATPTNNRPVFIELVFPPVPLPLPSGEFGGRVGGLQDPVVAARIDQVFANPGEFYLNLHTSGAGGFPDGAVRAQLPEPGALGLLAVVGIFTGRRGGVRA